MPSPSEITYSETSEQVFAERARDHFDVAKVFGGLSFVGVCPRCEHPMTNVWFDEIYYRARGQVPTQVPPGVPMICTCKVPHPATPNDLHGCGAYWVVDVE